MLNLNVEDHVKTALLWTTINSCRQRNCCKS